MTKVTISDALNQLKNLKSKVSRINAYIEQSIVYYSDQKPEYDYDVETSNRETLSNEIRNLKVKIQLANASTCVKQDVIDGVKSDVSLTELILLNADLRAELSYQQKLLDKTLVNNHRFNERTKDEITKVFAEGFDKTLIRTYVDTLEEKKEKIESLINSANLTNFIGE